MQLLPVVKVRLSLCLLGAKLRFGLRFNKTNSDESQIPTEAANASRDDENLVENNKICVG